MKRKLKYLYLILVFLFLFLPIIVLFIYSFNNSKLNIMFEGFTLSWYKEMFTNKELLISFTNTLLIALTSTIVSTIIGTISAIGMHKYNFFGEKFLGRLLYLPIVMPEIVLGISLLSIYSLFKLELSIFTILLSHIAFSIPFVLVNVKSSLNELDKSLIEASYDLGANETETLFHVIIPSIKEGIKSGALLAFTLSLDDVVISYFTAGPGSKTLPLTIYSIIKSGITPDVYALTTIMLLVVLLILTINTVIQFKKIRRIKI